MRNLHCIIIFAVSLTTASPADTTTYITSGCLEAGLPKSAATVSVPAIHSHSEISFHGDTVSLQGLVYANCCGSHLLAIAFAANQVVRLTQHDTGAPCDCNCPFTFLVNIPGFVKDTCRVIFFYLDEYALDTLDTMIVRTAPTGISSAPAGSKAARFNQTTGTEAALFDIQGRFIGRPLIRTTPGIYLFRSADNWRGTIKFVHD